MDDLLAVDSVLVSAGFNANDDFFDPPELARAAGTPPHKPANRDHVPTDVVGHIASAAVEGDPASPAGLSSRVLVYRHWARDAARQADSDAFAAELLDPPAEAPWCVSMECTFRGFDYALLPAGADPLDPAAARVVPRTSSTDFLTKHLRRYGGSGAYGGERLGRVLRNVHFTGVGFTRDPANPRSVLTGVGPVYADATATPRTPEPDPMPATPDAAETAAQAKLAETQAELTAARADRDAKAAELAAARAEAAEAKAALAAKAAELTALAARADAAEAAIAQAAAERAFAARVAQVQEAYACEAPAALAAAAPLKGLPDDAFAAHLDAMKALRAAAPKPAPAKPEAAAAAVAAAAVAAAAPETPAAPAEVAVAAAPSAQARLAAEMAAWMRPATAAK